MGESKKTRTLLHLFTSYVHDFKLKRIQNQAKMIDKFIGQYSYSKVPPQSSRLLKFANPLDYLFENLKIFKTV